MSPNMKYLLRTTTSKKKIAQNNTSAVNASKAGEIFFYVRHLGSSFDQY